MKIAVITMGMMQLHQGKYYNAQDIGLGRALADAGNEVDVFNFVSARSIHEEQIQSMEGSLVFHQLPSASVGVHSMYKKDFIPAGTQVAICFSDNQINFGRIYRLCKKRGIRCIPYIGVLISNNGNSIKGMIMNLIADNVKLYRTMPVLAKTPGVLEQMKKLGIKAWLAPVCLDEKHLNSSYEDTAVSDLKEELGRLYNADFNVPLLLYIARMQPEKQPLEMIDIFAGVIKARPECRLVVIGQGPLQEQMMDKAVQLGLQNNITHIMRVENSQMWKYIRAAEAVINLNRHEIFGMTILEAMYYEKRVVAIKAPGPEYIIGDDGTCGTLCDGYDDIVNELLSPQPDFDGKAAHNRITDRFLWKATAELILKQLEE